MAAVRFETLHGLVDSVAMSEDARLATGCVPGRTFPLGTLNVSSGIMARFLVEATRCPGRSWLCRKQS